MTRIAAAEAEVRADSAAAAAAAQRRAAKFMAGMERTAADMRAREEARPWLMGQVHYPLGSCQRQGNPQAPCWQAICARSSAPGSR